MALVAEAEEVPNKRVILKRLVAAAEHPTEEHMEVVAGAALLAVPPGSAGVVLKNLYLSCDPHARARMNRHEHLSYIVSFIPGEVMESYGVSKVIASGNPDFTVGDLVLGITGFEEYTFIPNPKSLLKINHPELPLSYYTSVLGMSGLTAWAGFMDVAKPKNGDYVFVSAALSAVGQVVGQLAKITGCYVVGSAGSDEKVHLLKTKLGFDEAFNYKKEPDLNATLKRFFPDGIDIYFENVGGAILDAVLLNMRNNGRITLCGMISQFNLQEREGARNLLLAILKRVRLEGFMAMDYIDQYHKFEEEMAKYVKEGQISCIEDVADGLEKAPAMLIGQRNVGKKLVAIARE